MARHVGCGTMGHFKKVYQRRRERAMNELEVKDVQEVSRGEIETVSIDSVHLNENQSLLTVKLETQAGGNTIVVPYKVDTGSEGNIMPLFIFKKLFKNTTEEKLQKSVKGHIRLRTYNKTNITQIGTCAVGIKFKNIKKRCVFFVVSGNSQVLLGMPDTAAHKLININIDSIQVEVGECKTNTGDTRKANIEQDMHMVKKCCANTDAHFKTKQGTNRQNGHNNTNKITNHFFSSSDVDADKRKSSKLMWEIHNTYGDVFNGIGCFEGTFSLQVKLDSKLYQVPLRCVPCALQKPFKEELECLQKMDIITPLGIDEMAEWSNSFVLVPKANGKVSLCLDPAKLNQALIRPIPRGPTLNNILPRLNNVKYMSIIDASLGYHNLQLDTKSSYLTTFACPFGRYWYKHLPFGAVLAGNMFQCKIDKIFNDMPSDDILVIGYEEDGTDHNEAVYNVQRQCKEVNLKLNKDKCHFRCTSIPFFGKVVSREGVQPDQQSTD